MVLLFHESITALRIVLTLYTPCCARTHSIAIDLITSKVRYSLWFTAELFTSGLCAWLTHAWYANSTNQTVRQTQVHSESSAGQIVGSWHPGSAHMRDALPSPPGTGFQNRAGVNSDFAIPIPIPDFTTNGSMWNSYSFQPVGQWMGTLSLIMGLRGVVVLWTPC